jgi:hypothetical protein
MSCADAATAAELRAARTTAVVLAIDLIPGVLIC